MKKGKEPNPNTDYLDEEESDDEMPFLKIFTRGLAIVGITALAVIIFLLYKFSGKN